MQLWQLFFWPDGTTCAISLYLVAGYPSASASAFTSYVRKWGEPDGCQIYDSPHFQARSESARQLQL